LNKRDWEGQRNLLLIKGEDGQSYVKIYADKEDDMGVRFTVETRCRGFSSTLAGIYIFFDDLSDFISEFQTLENERRGEARLRSASPDEFELLVRIIDRAGHGLISLRLQDLSYVEIAVIPCTLEVAFSIDPTTLPFILQKLTRQVQELR